MAWGLHAVVVILSTFFVLIYGLNYGEEKTVEWLITITESVAMNIVIIQPVKVCTLAAVLAVVVGSFEDENLVEVHTVPWTPG